MKAARGEGCGMDSIGSSNLLGGLVSGLDTQGIIKRMINVQRAPIRQLTADATALSKRLITTRR